MTPETPAYRSPDPPPTPARWNPRAVRALAMALAPFVLTTGFYVAATGLRLGFSRHAAVWLLGVLPLVTLAGVVLGVLGHRRGAAVLRETPEHPAPLRGRWLGGAASVGGALGVVYALLGFFATCLATMAFSRGRQLRRFGRVLLPPVATGDAWTTRAMEVRVDDVARSALAARWRENGRTEHASVAAFARLTLDLMALGAPAALLAAAQRDAADEVRHTELCFSLARAIDGRDGGSSMGAGGAFDSGRSTWKVDPWPGSLSTNTPPPVRRTISRTVASPRPVPLPMGLVVTYASKSRSRTAASMPTPVSRTVSRA
jgi:hypothetical protein